MKRIFAIVPIIVLIGIYLTFFVVDQRAKVIIFRFGEAIRIIDEPGLKFKLPFIDTVTEFDNRIQTLDTPEYLVTFSDNRRLVVDAFSRWRIKDVEKYFVTVRSGGQEAAKQRLTDSLQARLRAVLGSVTTGEVLSENRTALMRSVLEGVRPDAEEMGIEMIDVRIVRTDLPESNLEATIDRMISERDEEAAFQIAKGTEAAARIRANAVKEQNEIVSQAQKESEVIKGEADGERSRIFADAYGQDKEFFDFYRSLEAYKVGLAGNTTVLISPDDDFFRFFGSETGAN